MYRRKADTSFFRVIQKRLSSDFSGSLFGLMLVELGRHEPHVFCEFLNRLWGGRLVPAITRAIQAGEAQFEREYPFVANRYADVAILVNGEPVVLLEIKEEDVDAPRNAAQHSDYLRWVERESGSPSRALPSLFVHLSRYHARRVLHTPTRFTETVRAAFYGDFYRVLSDCTKSKHLPLAHMVMDYLEDIGVTSYQAINLQKQHKALTFLGVQMLGFDPFAGFGKLAATETTALSGRLLETLTQNAAVFGDWLYNDNLKLFSQQPIARFKTEVGCRRSALQKAVERHDDVDEALVLDDRIIQEGSIYVFSAPKFGGPMRGAKGWMYVTMGFQVWLERNNRDGAHISLYAQFDSDQFEGAWDESEWLEEFPSEDEALRILSKLLQKARRKALKSATGAHKRALEMLCIPQIAKSRAARS